MSTTRHIDSTVNGAASAIKKAPVITSAGSGYIKTSDTDNLATVRTTESGEVAATWANRLNLLYLRTIASFLRILAVLFAIIVLICIGAAKHNYKNSCYKFIQFTAGFALVWMLIVSCLYCCSIPFILAGAASMVLCIVLFAFNAIWCLFYFIGGCISIAAAREFDHCKPEKYPVGCSNSKDAWAASAAFCWFAAIIHGVLAFLAFKAILVVRRENALHKSDVTTEHGRPYGDPKNGVATVTVN